MVSFLLHQATESVSSTTDSNVQDTPYLSDVYKYYDEDLPPNFGERDPSPPPMSRRDVINLNKKVGYKTIRFSPGDIANVVLQFLGAINFITHLCYI